MDWDYEKNVGERIRSLRIKNKLTQEQQIVIIVDVCTKEIVIWLTIQSMLYLIVNLIKVEHIIQKRMLRVKKHL